MFGYNYNIPNYGRFMYPRRNFGNRFFYGNSFAFPFLLGGITGAVLSNNQPSPYQNYYYNQYYSPYWYY